MTLAPVSKVTNGLVEIGLISVSILLGALGLPFWVIAIMVSVGLGWWGFVHAGRLRAVVSGGALSALGNLAVALMAISFGHIVAFGLGSAFHTIMGLK